MTRRAGLLAFDFTLGRFSIGNDFGRGITLRLLFFLARVFKFHQVHIILNRFHQRVTTLAGRRRNFKDRTRPAVVFDKLRHAFGTGLGIEHVEFIQHQPTWFVI